MIGVSGRWVGGWEGKGDEPFLCGRRLRDSMFGAMCLGRRGCRDRPVRLLVFQSLGREIERRSRAYLTNSNRWFTSCPGFILQRPNLRRNSRGEKTSLSLR